MMIKAVFFGVGPSFKHTFGTCQYDDRGRFSMLVPVLNARFGHYYDKRHFFDLCSLHTSGHWGVMSSKNDLFINSNQLVIENVETEVL